MQLLFSSAQWLIFMLAGSIIAPLAIGNAFAMSPAEIAGLMQRTFFVLGISGLLQVWFGHKLPIVEGPASLWWGVFMIYAGLAASGVIAKDQGLQQLTMGMFISAGLSVALGVGKCLQVMKKLFTPLVTGTYLILLTAQLSGPIIKGVLGIGYLSGQVDLKVAVPALIILLAAVFMAKSSQPFFRNYSVLISLSLGWVLFILLGIDKEMTGAGQVFSLPSILVWGMPRFSAGITITALFIGVLLLTNMLATVNVVEAVLRQQTRIDPVDYNQTSVLIGVNTGLSGLFSAVGCVPISATAGFMLTTKAFDRLPFILGAVLMVVISFFPPLTAFFASIPMPVGYASVVLPFASMVGIALKSYQSLALDERELFIIGMSLMVGIGSMFISAQATSALPSVVSTLLNNGLILGMGTCILLEQGIRL